MTFAAGTQPSLTMVIVPVGGGIDPERGQSKQKKKKERGKIVKVAEMSERFTFINAQAVDHSGGNNFIGVPIA